MSEEELKTMSEEELKVMSEKAGSISVKKWKRAKVNSSVLAFLLALPSLLITGGILIPFAVAIILSFTSYSFTDPVANFVGVKNWVDMFTSFQFWHGMIITFEYAALSLAIEFGLGIVMALILNKENAFTKVLRVVLLFPLMIAPVIATLVWQLMLNTSVGIVPKFLDIFGIHNVALSASPSTALFVAVIIDAWIYTPFVTLLLLAGLQSFSKSPFEAAKLDGASSWFAFKNLTFPMLKPYIYIALVFRVAGTLKMFTIPFALTGGGPGDALMNLSLIGYDKGFAYFNLAPSLPYVLILWAVIFVISDYLINQWVKVKKIER